MQVFWLRRYFSFLFLTFGFQIFFATAEAQITRQDILASIAAVKVPGPNADQGTLLKFRDSVLALKNMVPEINNHPFRRDAEIIQNLVEKLKQLRVAISQAPRTDPLPVEIVWEIVKAHLTFLKTRTEIIALVRMRDILEIRSFLDDIDMQLDVEKLLEGDLAPFRGEIKLSVLEPRLDRPELHKSFWKLRPDEAQTYFARLKEVAISETPETIRSFIQGAKSKHEGFFGYTAYLINSYRSTGSIFEGKQPSLDSKTAQTIHSALMVMEKILEVKRKSEIYLLVYFDGEKGAARPIQNEAEKSAMEAAATSADEIFREIDQVWLAYLRVALFLAVAESKEIKASSNVFSEVKASADQSQETLQKALTDKRRQSGQRRNQIAELISKYSEATEGIQASTTHRQNKWSDRAVEALKSLVRRCGLRI